MSGANTGHPRRLRDSKEHHPGADRMKRKFAGLDPFGKAEQYVRHERMKKGEIPKDGKPDDMIDASIDALDQLLREDCEDADERESLIEMARQAAKAD